MGETALNLIVRWFQRVAGASLLGACLFFAAAQPPARASILFYSGDLRTDATVLDCGLGCTLGPADSDDSFAQFAALVTNFSVSTAGPVEAITYGFGGGP